MRVHVVVIRLMSASVMKDAVTALAVLVRARMVESQTSVTLNLLAEKLLLHYTRLTASFSGQPG